MIDTVAAAAKGAFLEARSATLEDRAGWLESIAQALEAHRAELTALAAEETHLPDGRLQGELTRTIFQLNLLASETRSGEFLDVTIDHADPEWGMGPRPDIRRLNLALGPVAVFGASNFPFAFSVIGGDSAAALAAGCSVIHKRHEAHERLAVRTTEVVREALAAAGAPANLFDSVQGRETAVALVQHPIIAAVGFTGSIPGGRALYDLVQRREAPIPFFGELGSVNPVVVTERAWAERRPEILDGLAASFTQGNGQFCTKPGVVFVPAGEAELPDITERLGTALAEVSNGKMLTGNIHDGFLRAREEVGGREGVATLIDGDHADPPRPAVLRTDARTAAGSPEIFSEMFGPATLLVTYQGTEEIDAALAGMGGQLSGTVHAGEGEDISAYAQALSLHCGRVLRDGWPTGVTVSYATVHGGPYPATSANGTTSVGTAAIGRFTRAVAFQGFADGDLPGALQESNPLGLRRRVDGAWVDA